MNTKQFVDEMTGRGPFTVDHGAETVARPNIFFLSVDMVPPEFYESLPGRVRPRTPNLDALRSDATVFTNTFCTSPLCTPSRASFLTGRFSYITTNSERGHDGHAIHLRDDDTIFPEYLKASGYSVRHFGKSHVGTHKFLDVFGENDSPWDRWSPPWHDDDQYRELLAEHGVASVSFSRSITGVDPSGSGTGNNYGGWLAGPGGEPFPREATYPYFLARKAVKAMNVVKEHRPLYMQLDFFEPHQPFAIPGGMAEREEELRRLVTLPESYKAIEENGFVPPWQEPRIYRMYRKNWGMRDPSSMMDYLIANILQFEVLDQAIGIFLDGLRSHGLYDDAWIVFLADHGEMNGEWALLDKGAYLNPRVLRVPLYMKRPHGEGERATELQTPSSLLDVAPTILEAAGITTYDRLDGVSLISQATGRKRGEGHPVLSEVWSHVLPNPAVSIVFRSDEGDDYLYTFNTVDDMDELYSLSRSASIHNMSAAPEMAGVLRQAIVKLDHILASDQRFRGYSSFLRLRHAEVLEEVGGDRQLFI